MAEPIPIHVQPTLAPEDQARGDFYALIARLFYAGPDTALLRELASAAPLAAEGADRELAQAWSGLVQAAASVDAEAAKQAYDDLFIGTGKAAVTPYATFYLVTTGREKILVRLRDELSNLGLARRAGTHEPEDHFASLAEVMRYLVSRGSTEAALAQQRDFFERYLARSFTPLCDAVITHQEAGQFQKAAARFVKAFLTVEARAFEMLA
jgi:TorA maturation chaperone TorD